MFGVPERVFVGNEWVGSHVWRVGGEGVWGGNLCGRAEGSITLMGGKRGTKSYESGRVLLVSQGTWYKSCVCLCYVDGRVVDILHTYIHTYIYIN